MLFFSFSQISLRRILMKSCARILFFWQYWPKVKRGFRSLEFVGTQMNNSSSLLGVLHCSTVLDLGDENGPENEWRQSLLRAVAEYALVEGFQAELWPLNRVNLHETARGDRAERHMTGHLEVEVPEEEPPWRFGSGSAWFSLGHSA